MGFLDSLFQGFQKVFGNVGNAVGGAANSIGQAATKALPSLMGGGGSASQLMNSFMPKGQPQKPMSPQPNRMSSPGGRLPMNTMPPTGAGFSGGVDAEPAAKGHGIMDLFKNNQVLQGLGVMGAGQLFGGNPKKPDFNTPDVQRYQNMPLNNFRTLDPNVEALINRNVDVQQDQQSKQLRDVYKNVRPGTDYTTDSAYQRDLANLQRSQTLNRSDALAGAQFQSNQQDLQLNQQELSRASELAQLSVSEIMLETGMDYAEAQQIKEMFGKVGGMFVSKGLGLDSFDVDKNK